MSAFDYLKGREKGVVYFPPGKTKTSDPSIQGSAYSDIEIRGAGNASVIEAAGTGVSNLLTFKGTDQTFDGRLQHLAIKDVRLSTQDVNQNCDLLALENCTHVDLDLRCEHTDGYGVHLRGVKELEADLELKQCGNYSNGKESLYIVDSGDGTQNEQYACENLTFEDFWARSSESEILYIDSGSGGTSRAHNWTFDINYVEATSASIGAAFRFDSYFDTGTIQNGKMVADQYCINATQELKLANIYLDSTSSVAVRVNNSDAEVFIDNCHLDGSVAGIDVDSVEHLNINNSLIHGFDGFIQTTGGLTSEWEAATVTISDSAITKSAPTIARIYRGFAVSNLQAEKEPTFDDTDRTYPTPIRADDGSWGLNNFRGQSTDASGQITVSFFGEFLDKPRLDVQVEGEYQWYIASWSTVDRSTNYPYGTNYTGVTIQVTDSSGTAVGSGVSADLFARPQ